MEMIHRWTSGQDQQLRSGLAKLYPAVVQGIPSQSISPQSPEPTLADSEIHRLAEGLAAYGKLLLQWQEAFHLLGEPHDFVDVHLLDSVSGAFLLQHLFPQQKKWQIVDVGSGLGLPGIPLALCFSGVQFYLVEPGRRRANILRSIVRELDLHSCVSICEHPVEEWGKHQNIEGDNDRCIVTCRAFRPLNKKSWKQLQAPLPLQTATKCGVLLYKGDPVKAQKELAEGAWTSSVFALPHCHHQRSLFYRDL